MIQTRLSSEDKGQKRDQKQDELFVQRLMVKNKDPGECQHLPSPL